MQKLREYMGRLEPGEWRRLLRMAALLAAVVVGVSVLRGSLESRVSAEKEPEKVEESRKAGKKKEESGEKSAKKEASEKTPEKASEPVDAEAKEIAEAEAVEASIVPGQYPIMGMSSIRPYQMAAYFERNGSPYPAEALAAGGAPDISAFAQIFYEEAVKEGVRPEVAFAQTMKETGWLQYGGDADISQYNFAGLGTTGGGVPGNQYPDVRTGVRAQIQHLKAYATDEALAGDCVDERYAYVTKGSAPYVEWLGQKENPQGFGWATGENYGYDIVEMIHAMREQK